MRGIHVQLAEVYAEQNRPSGTSSPLALLCLLPCCPCGLCCRCRRRGRRRCRRRTALLPSLDGHSACRAAHAMRAQRLSVQRSAIPCLAVRAAVLDFVQHDLQPLALRLGQHLQTGRCAKRVGVRRCNAECWWAGCNYAGSKVGSWEPWIGGHLQCCTCCGWAATAFARQPKQRATQPESCADDNCPPAPGCPAGCAASSPARSRPWQPPCWWCA